MAKWRNKIEIKKYLSSENSNEKVLEVVSKLIPQLKSISRFEERLTEKESPNALDFMFLDDFVNLVQEFEWIKNSIQNSDDPTQYSFDDWCEAFNEYLNQLYDMADVVTNDSDSWTQREKFLWVG
jgi:hypothetical protein